MSAPSTAAPESSELKPNHPGAAGVHHRNRDFYSQNKPIPSIQRFFKRGLVDVITNLREGDSESEEEKDSTAKEGKGFLGTDKLGQKIAEREQSKSKSQNQIDINEAQAQTEDLSQSSQASQTNKNAASVTRRTHKSRLVDDPITGKKVYVHDVGKREYDRAMQNADQIDETQTQSNIARSKKINEVDNVLSMPFPPLQNLPTSVLKIHPFLLPAFALWSALLIFGVVHPALSVIGAAWLGWWAHKKLQEGAEDNRWERERQRGRQARNPPKDRKQTSFDEVGEAQEGVKEGAEWLNAIMEGLWAVMNPELFSSMGATLEDVMQASIPKFIHAVKVEDLAQGSTPLRMTGFRVLPDAEAKDLQAASQEHLRQERTKEEKKLSQQEGFDDDDSSNKKKKAEDLGGTFINLELSFVYRARPTADTVASKSRNAHLLIKFWVGAKKLVTVPLPVWVEIKGIVGSVRTRVQLTPDPPFIKNVTFSFMGLPRVGVEVIPLHINTSNIPLLSGFIQGSIDAALGEYCAPSSLTMDMGEMLMGDNIKREVDALGVAVIYIHSAHDLEKQDVQGSSDPYCTIQLAKYGKVQYATRVALDDLSPRWEERYVMLIHPEAVRAREKISVGLWDSDRFSADDILGRAEVDLLELVKRPGRLFRRTDTLVGLTQDSKKQGLLHWSVGFFAKTPNKRRLTSDEARKIEEEETELVDSQDPDAIDVKEVEVGKDFHINKDNKDELAQETADIHRELKELHLDQYDSRITSQQTRHIEHAVAFEPPNPALPSGVLSMQVHQISKLEVTDSRSQRNVGTKGRRMGQAGQQVDSVDTDEDKPNAPSAYVTIILNDETVFRSRTKALSTNPFYNAGTERFIRDWRRTLVMFVVYDNRLREDDAILGVVPIKLTDLFQSTSQATSVFPLAGGVGRGHLRVSLLFRPIQALSRHKEKLGWDIGTMRILSSLNASEMIDGQEGANVLSSASIRARTLAGQHRISSRRAKYTDKREKGEVEWYLRKEEFPVKVPVRRRYATPFVIEFRTYSALGLHKTVAMSILWMQDVADDEILDYCLPIWRAKEGGDFHRLQQNYHNFRKEEEAHRFGVEKMGSLQVKLQFKSGVGKIHTKFESINPDAKCVMDAWRACTSVGLRSVMGDFSDMRWNTKGMPMDQVRESRDLGQEEGEPSESESDYDEEENTAGEYANEESILDRLRNWKDERKELHRQHKGLNQYKGVRTVTWIGRGIRDRGSRAANSLTLQDRRAGQVETEL
ncbi:uncharacterized protein FA14DRAFT_146898 [Meira miltonrushii]|uniref:C2 domain-containing protein n=1 Tax=Meira miltonrushii TaxID=1280837 RepID=A0A316V817_9BASI|nr:uncharacterized protein FA14DRAFT_146898 [Meira miltonrushii]PWN33168.1 hypothetical protein FA14DRAFT_146898 [Meira miltonrushii]